jgi:hypothetical protein
VGLGYYGPLLRLNIPQTALVATLDTYLLFDNANSSVFQISFSSIVAISTTKCDFFATNFVNFLS